MDLKDIFIGKTVKSKTREGDFNVLRLDDYEEKVFCIPLNSIDNEVKAFRVEELKEV